MKSTNIIGKHCVVNYSDFGDLKNKALETRDYFDECYKEIIEILKPGYYFYNSVHIRFAKVDNPGYYQGKIEIDPTNHLARDNMGCLIHEGTHAVQNYIGEIDKNHACWPWMEGIADYCRANISKDISLRKGNPNNGYSETAHFLSWAVKICGENTVMKLNEKIHDSSNQLINNDQIFVEAIGKSYRELLQSYIESGE